MPVSSRRPLPAGGSDRGRERRREASQSRSGRAKPVGQSGRGTRSGRRAAHQGWGGGRPDDAKVLRSFVSDGRLVSIPAHENKRIVVLRWALETCFAEDRAYPESEVNDRLRELNEDTAALRRYLVETGLMDRQSGVYRRRPLREVRPGV